MFRRIVIVVALLTLSLSGYAAQQFKISSYMSTIMSNNSIEMSLKLHGINNELVLLYFYPEGVTLPENSSDTGSLGTPRYFVHQYINKYQYSLDLLRNAPSVYFIYAIDKQARLQTIDAIPVGGFVKHNMTNDSIYPPVSKF